MNTHRSFHYQRLRGLPALTATLLLGLAAGVGQAQDSQAVLVDAAYSSALTVDGNAADWVNLSSGVVAMDTQGRGSNGTLAVDVRYAWDETSLYVLVQENPKNTFSTHAQEGPDGAAYLSTFYLFDCIAFWLDLDNNAGTTVDESVVVENNADFQPWFGFSSAGRTDLIYCRANDSGTLNLDGLANARVATAGTFAAHNRSIEVAIAWADIAATVDPLRQPGGDLLSVVAAGYVFGSEPLLINNDFNGQAFIGPAQYEPPSGTDSNSRDIRLVATVVVPALEIRSAGNTVVVQWTASAAGYALESVSELNRGDNWSTVAVDPILDPGSGMIQVVLPAAGGTAFYRLRN